MDDLGGDVCDTETRAISKLKSMRERERERERDKERERERG